MAEWDYIRYDAVEIVNTARLDTYARTLGLGFYTCRSSCDTLPQVLGAMGWRKPTEYTTPAGDEASWYDEEVPESGGFAGMSILEASGWVDSTYTAQTSESLIDGGFVGKGRYATREITLRALLIARNLPSLRYGINWLSTIVSQGDPCRVVRKIPLVYSEYLAAWSMYKNADLTTDDDMYQNPLFCGTPHTYDGVNECLLAKKDVGEHPISVDDYYTGEVCGGHQMEFFAGCPTVETREDLYRYFLDVHCTRGVTVLAVNEVTGAKTCEDSGAWAEVEFTLTAAIPFAFAASKNITASLITSFNVPDASAAPVPSSATAPPWVDPACPPVIAFPGTPSDDLTCTPPYAGPWTRTVYETVKLPKFTVAALILDLAAKGQDFSDVRIRLVPEDGDPDVDYDVQLYSHWIPNEATLRVDGRRRHTIMYTGKPGGTDFLPGAAGHLVSADVTSGAYRYPTITCGGNYKVIVDVPATNDPAMLDVNVFAVGREG